jgi:hypothetical protein
MQNILRKHQKSIFFGKNSRYQPYQSPEMSHADHFYNKSNLCNVNLALFYNKPSDPNVLRLRKLPN